MQLFIAHQNLRRFREQLGNCPDELQRKTLEQLLAVEERKLTELNRTHC